MNALENELEAVLRDQQSKMFLQVDGKRVEYERTVRAEHRKLRTRLFHWLTTYRPQTLMTGPIIYAMALPLADLCISFLSGMLLADLRHR